MKFPLALIAAIVTLPAFSESNQEMPSPSPIDSFYIPMKNTLIISPKIGLGKSEQHTPNMTSSELIKEGGLDLTYALSDRLSFSLGQNFASIEEDATKNKRNGVDNPQFGLLFSQKKDELLLNGRFDASIVSGSKAIRKAENTFALTGSISHMKNAARYGIAASINHSSDADSAAGFQGDVYIQYFINPKHAIKGTAGFAVRNEKKSDTSQSLFGLNYSFAPNPSNLLDIQISLDSKSNDDDHDFAHRNFGLTYSYILQ